MILGHYRYQIDAIESMAARVSLLESCIIALQCILANLRICGLSYSEAQAMISQQYCRCHTASAKPKTQSAYAARGRYGVLGSIYYDIWSFKKGFYKQLLTLYLYV